MNIAVALSGGGLRATLFHLGVIYRMHKSGDLRNVRAIFSVSGGSILGAHLRQHWERYTGGEAEFQAAAREVRQLCRRDLRGRVVRRAVLCWLLLLPQLLKLIGKRRWAERLSPAQFLIQEYDEFLNSAPLQASGANAPSLHILATSLNTGEVCAFEDDRFRLRRRMPLTAPTAGTPAALAVAASSAYPALFTPVRVDSTVIPDMTETHFLSDGGLFDNLGIVEMLAFERASGHAFDRIVVSDAGAALAADRQTALWGIFRRAIRTSDILMTRMADNARLAFEHDPRVTVLSIHSRVLHSEVSDETQATIRTVRTDLDVFTPLEQAMIVNHGIEVASQELYRSEPVNSPEVIENRPLHGSRKPSLFGLINVRDWTTWATAAVLALWFTAFAYALAYRDLRHDYQIAKRHEFEKIGDIAADLINVRSGSDTWRAGVENLRFTEFWEHQTLTDASMAARTYPLRWLTWVHNGVAAAIGFEPPFPALNNAAFDNGRSCLASKDDSNVRTNAVLDYAHAVGQYWHDEDKAHFKEARDRHYLHMTRIVDQITHAEAVTPELADEFLRYYYGRLLPLESQATASEEASVESAMVAFGNLLNEWRTSRKRPPLLEEARNQLVNRILLEHATEPPVIVLFPEYCPIYPVTTVQRDPRPLQARVETGN
ncbi:MAG: hypothetical protein FJW30_26240 [Acidobacteria bacterium]|nr:hypothetical protein [Acidobacteriota bacterium]